MYELWRRVYFHLLRCRVEMRIEVICGFLKEKESKHAKCNFSRKRKETSNFSFSFSKLERVYSHKGTGRFLLQFFVSIVIIPDICNKRLGSAFRVVLACSKKGGPKHMHSLWEKEPKYVERHFSEWRAAYSHSDSTPAYIRDRYLSTTTVVYLFYSPLLNKNYS